MANRFARSKRPLLKPVHTWAGIVSGLFLSALAITGSTIVFRAELERAALPKAAPPGDSAARVTLNDAARAVVQARPAAHIRRIRFPETAGSPYIFQIDGDGKRTERIVTDAASGRVLGTLETGTLDWLVDLHHNFLAGKQGRKAVGVAGIALFLLSATGILMWLRGPRNWRAWISVRRSGTTRRFHFELHRAAGLWAYGFLAVISFTGIELAFPDSFRAAVQSMTGESAGGRAPKLTRGGAPASLDELLRMGRAAMPDGVPVELRFPESGKGPIDLRLYRPGDLPPSGNHVYLDPSTAQVLQVDRLADKPAGTRFLAALGVIHYGQFGGLPIRIGWALLGLAPVLLFVTGLIVWWRPSRRNRGQPDMEKADDEDFALAGR